MKIDIVVLSKEELYKLDIFFKKQYRSMPRYGTMGGFFWKILMNPFKEGFINAVKSDENIVSTATITPKNLRVNQETVLAAEVGDTFTDYKHQVKGYFGALVKESRIQANGNGIKFVYATPNFQSLPGYKRFAKFEPVPFLQIHTFRFELRIDHILRPKIGLILASAINIFFRFGIILYSTALSFLNARRKDGVIELSDSIPDDWDNFWEVASKQWDFIFTRDSVSLKWRFFLNPENYSFLIARVEGKIVGYVVYRQIIDLSVSRIIIGDFLFLSGYEELLSNCLQKIREVAIKTNAHSIGLWCDIGSVYKSLFKQNGFFQNKNIPIICFKDDFSESLKHLKRIHFTLSDSDNI